MKHVYLSPITARSNTMTAVPASNSLASGSVMAWTSLGLTITTSTWRSASSASWARCLPASFCASITINRKSGCWAAAASMSAFICARHGSSTLARRTPIARPFGCSSTGVGRAGGRPHPSNTSRATNRSRQGRQGNDMSRILSLLDVGWDQRTQSYQQS